ncbi:hypothetical protein K431DRAFT_211313, partial [Polychaeton citri CBS 116435]
MRPTGALLRYCVRLTLFTRDNCSLCDDAWHNLSKVWDRRPFEFDKIDVMAAGNKKWKELYEFDTPVVHIDKTKEDSQFETSAAARKLMHRFTEAEVEKVMDE